MQSNIYRRLIEEHFAVGSLGSVHCNTSYKVVVMIREALMKKAASSITQTSKEANQVDARNYKNTNAGLAKIRYIAGWCTVKIKTENIKIMKRNLYNVAKKDYVAQKHRVVQYL